MNFSTILKLAKGGQADFSSILQELGMQVSMQPVSLEDAPGALRSTAVAAGRRGASLHRLAGRMQSGESIQALIVMVPPAQPAASDLHGESRRAIVAAS